MSKGINLDALGEWIADHIVLGVTKEDAMGTPFEYLFAKEFEYSNYHEDDDLYWSWEG